MESSLQAKLNRNWIKASLDIEHLLAENVILKADLEILRAKNTELERQLERLYRVGHCGSVDSFLACDDEVKRGYFAMMIEESTENKRLQAENASLKKQLETETMRLVACDVVARADTVESAAKAREMHPDYLSAACESVMRRVDECISLRAENAALRIKHEVACGTIEQQRADIDTIRGYLDAMKKSCERNSLVAQHRIKELRGAIISVLCDPEGTPCFAGSDGDRKVIAEALATPDNAAELDALIKDAMRYRWMRDVADFPAICAPDGDGDDWDWVPMRNKEQANAAIDAAMQSDTPPKE